MRESMGSLHPRGRQCAKGNNGLGSATIDDDDVEPDFVFRGFRNHGPKTIIYACACLLVAGSQ